jgi:hypothetical protein
MLLSYYLKAIIAQKKNLATPAIAGVLSDSIESLCPQGTDPFKIDPCPIESDSRPRQEIPLSIGALPRLREIECTAWCTGDIMSIPGPLYTNTQGRN